MRRGKMFDERRVFVNNHVFRDLIDWRRKCHFSHWQTNRNCSSLCLRMSLIVHLCPVNASTQRFSPEKSNLFVSRSRRVIFREKKTNHRMESSFTSLEVQSRNLSGILHNGCCSMNRCRSTISRPRWRLSLSSASGEKKKIWKRRVVVENFFGWLRKGFSINPIGSFDWNKGEYVSNVSEEFPVVKKDEEGWFNWMILSMKDLFVFVIDRERKKQTTDEEEQFIEWSWIFSPFVCLSSIVILVTVHVLAKGEKRKDLKRLNCLFASASLCFSLERSERKWRHLWICIRVRLTPTMNWINRLN